MSGGGWLPPSDAGSAYVPPAAPAPGPVAATGGPAPAGGTAPYGARVQAAVVDLLVRLGIVVAFGALGAIAFVGGSDAGQAGIVAGIVTGAVVGLAYAPLWMARNAGQTIGHRTAGTRVVRRDGTPLDGRGGFVREVLAKALLIEGLGGIAFSIPTILNYLWPLWDDRDEALHDKLCGTRVVPA